jgi:methylated-DNA-protein-cysteine methyltransferase-like protein
MNDFTLHVIKIIKLIPPGNVISYGAVARLAGNPRAARQVGWILNSHTQKEGLPWQRVVNSKLEISLTDDGFSKQKELLLNEGVQFITEKRIDKSCLWNTETLSFQLFFEQETF